MIFLPKSCPNPSARRILLQVLLWDFALLLFSAAVELTWRFRDAPEAIRQLARSSSEDGLITWTSIVSMFSAGIACLVLGSRSGRLGWKLSGLFFVYLSMDDGALLHERLGDLLGEKQGGVYFWVISVMPVMAFLGCLAFLQIWRATRANPRIRRGILLAFSMWGLALACEIFERPLRLEQETLRGISLHRYLMFIEEALELLAPLIMLYCVLSLIEISGARAKLDQRASPGSAATGAGRQGDQQRSEAA